MFGWVCGMCGFGVLCLGFDLFGLLVCVLIDCLGGDFLVGCV